MMAIRGILCAAEPGRYRSHSGGHRARRTNQARIMNTRTRTACRLAVTAKYPAPLKKVSPQASLHRAQPSARLRPPAQPCRGPVIGGAEINLARETAGLYPS